MCPFIVWTGGYVGLTAILDMAMKVKVLNFPAQDSNLGQSPY
jgi:hypothetical protein